MPVRSPELQEEDAGSTTSAFTAPQINLPKGGGAIRGIGEKFSANAVTGTGSMAVPIAVSKSRSGFMPQLTLSYDSGAGNGVFGMGWSLPLPGITRKTDKGLPQYRDSEESDIFILSGAEDLVPVLEPKKGGGWRSDEFERDGYRVKRYRPRVEGLFSRIERWTRLADNDIHWRSISKDNVLTLYGITRQARIADPANERHIFSWLICASYDDKGDAIVYEYAPEDERGVDRTRADERNRVRTANRYLKRIRYGNRRPMRGDFPAPEGAGWLFEIVFDYGDEDVRAAPAGDNDIPAVEVRDAAHSWPVRRDPFSAYRSGFETRTYRLCRGVFQFHHFPEELETPRYLVRSTRFEYRERPIGSLLTRVVQSGYRHRFGNRYLQKNLPALELDYSTSPLEEECFEPYELKQAGTENLPEGIDGEDYHWLDLDGEGIAGVLTEQSESWYYKRNLGKGRFGPMELISPRPSLAALGGSRQQMLDLSGDGKLDLVDFPPGPPGFYEREFKRGWAPFRAFRSLPVLDWDDPNLRFVDVTGDGIADILITEDVALEWHPSYLACGFGPAVRIPVPADEQRGPRVVFADGTESIYLADMSGDGLTDIVRIRNGDVCYWPNLGYGHFGPKVTMDQSPWFDTPDGFEQRRIRLADTDGSGTTDILYIGSDGIHVYLNQSGNAWSNRRTLKNVPTDDLNSISIADFLGRGTACLVWSSPLPGYERRPLRYVDLMRGRKPHLLIRIENHRGAEVAIEYASSTEFYLGDRAAGQPWVTQLPFPVHVVKRVETNDLVSRNRFITRYSYHHGYFDGVEREFRGFGRVDHLDTEELGALTAAGSLPAENENASWNVPPVFTRTWFHTGVFLGGERVANHLAHEYYREPGRESAVRLEETVLPTGLAPDEVREACRALKGSTLRQEIYALDGSEESSRPYNVTESNYSVRPLQPRCGNAYAVFFAFRRESATLLYERKLYEVEGGKRADPRIVHSLSLEVDDYGNVLKSFNIAYPRLFPDRSDGLSEAERNGQQRPLVSFSENLYTNAVRTADAYRNPMAAETRAFELTGLRPEAGHLLRFADALAIVKATGDGCHDLPFEAWDGAPDVPYRRLYQKMRTVYRSDRLDRLLGTGKLESLALPGEVYRLAFTADLLVNVFRRETSGGGSYEQLLPDASTVLGVDGGYVDLDRDGHWWIPSGRLFYSADAKDSSDAELASAQRHFFLPRRFQDAFGNNMTVTYDRHDLVLTETRDAIGNVVKARIDYRTLTPALMTDINGNRSAVAFDALGMLAGTALMGKEGERAGDSLEGFVADLSESEIRAHMRDPLHDPQAVLGNATTRIIYDLFAFERTRRDKQPQPEATYSLARETHEADLAPGERTRIQHSFSYTDGLGREIQSKLQAEPGPLDGAGPVDPRWIGSGWVIFNNKGSAVRKYEPFFSATHEFEFANMAGVSPTMFYDPVQRVIATLYPDHSWEKAVFEPWRVQTWDGNDTVLEDPADDPDIGGFLRRLPRADYLPTWREQRESGDLGPDARSAAAKAAVHARTPSLACFDPMGRVWLTVERNRFERGGSVVEERFHTRLELDIEGRDRRIIDALGRRIMSYDYDMVGNRIHQVSADAGARWMLKNATDKALRSWDSLGRRFRFTCDALRRPTDSLVIAGGAPERLYERIVYGEGRPDAPAANLRGKVFEWLDGGGVSATDRYDFKGNLLRSSRRLLRDYQNPVDWHSAPALEADTFTTSTVYDALNRPLTITAADASVYRLTYNEANLLEQLHLNLRGADSATAIVTNIDYNARGQRELIEYGNGAHTRYTYDALTFRLNRLETLRHGEDTHLQDLRYTYDTVGNTTSMRDHARQTVFFANQAASPDAEYVYDSLYRLLEATGREHIGLAGAPETTWDDAPRTRQALPGDGQAMRRYRRSYELDAVGNILELIHSAEGGSWRRKYGYSKTDNRLATTKTGQYEEHYQHDAHGNMTRMPHLVSMEWDIKDQLASTRAQVAHDGPGETTYYVYDAAGQRLRKVTVGPAGARLRERLYLGGFEIYREYTGGDVSLETTTLHVVDDKRRVAMVQTRGAETVFRYQFDNTLGSSLLELDEDAAIISYEEYYPYGATSWQAGRSASETGRKRYRYTGKERDEETGLDYFGARYYASWLGRWTSCDPLGLKDSLNLFEYSKSNPIQFRDPDGKAIEGYYIGEGRPRGQAWQWFMGLAAHRLIAYHYRQNYPDDTAYFNFISLANILRLSGAGDPDLLRPRERNLRPDITNTTTREVFEIKPFNNQGLLDGRREVKQYLEGLNRAAPADAQFRLGINESGELGVMFRGGKVGWRLKWDTTEPGVIQYKWQKLNPKDPDDRDSWQEAYEYGLWVDVTEAEMQEHAEAVNEAVQVVLEDADTIQLVEDVMSVPIDIIGTVATTFLSLGIFQQMSGGVEPVEPAQPGVAPAAAPAPPPVPAEPAPPGKIIPFPAKPATPPPQPATAPLRKAA